MTERHKTRVLVTGATGFLGGNIIRAMADNPDIVCVAACREGRNCRPLTRARCQS